MRQQLNDLIPPQKKTIRDVAMDDIGRDKSRASQRLSSDYNYAAGPNIGNKKWSKMRYGVVGALALIVIIAAGAGASSLFAGATVELIPKQVNAYINNAFTGTTS